MKKTGVLLSIILCLMLCINMLPVYGMEAAEDSSTIDTVIEITEETETVEPGIDITDEPEIMPLTPPAGIKTSLVNNKHVKITWNKVYNATGYEVYRCINKNGQYKLQGTVTKTEYIDTTVYKGRGFYYKICAINSENPEMKSEMSQSAVYYMKPGVTTVTTRNNNGKITVSWKKVSGADKYYVSRMNDKGIFIRIGVTDKLTFTDTKGLKNAFLNYKVRAVYFQDGKTITGDLSKTSRVLSRYVNPNKKMVALTFDDGPSKYTKSIVTCLFNNNSAATFFVVGNRIDSYKDTVIYTHNRGCELANHSYSHPLLTGLTAKQIKSQVKKTDNKIKNLTGQTTAIMRAPYGGIDSTVKKNVGKPLIQWSDDTMDWKTRSKSATVNYVMNHVSDGDIILMHDIHEPTKNAALELIPKLRAKGYQIVTVSELAKYKGYTMKKGSVYNSFR